MTKQSKINSADFIEKLKKSNTSAQEEVVNTYTKHLYNAALGKGFSKEEAQDLTQQTFLTFFEVVKRFEGRSTVRTFLFGILFNKSMELRRDFKKESMHDSIDDVWESQFDSKGHWSNSSSPKNPEDFLESQEKLGIIEQCLEKLPEVQKNVFTLKIVEETETEEICNILSISPTNLRQLLFRGRNRLRLCVEASLMR